MSEKSNGKELVETGNAKPSAALLIIDMLSDFEFEDGDKLFKNACGIVDNIQKLKKQAKAKGIPVVYVNDNYGRWNEDFKSYIAKLRKDSEKARTILEKLEPAPDDHFVLKPQRSGFYATALAGLLMSLNASSVIVTGVTTDICILFTAHDAYMRGFYIHVPEDCCAAVEPEHHKYALDFLCRVADADTTASQWIGLFDQEIFNEDQGSNENGDQRPGVSGWKDVRESFLVGAV